jgi:hypothetical protein
MSKFHVHPGSFAKESGSTEDDVDINMLEEIIDKQLRSNNGAEKKAVCL